MTNDRERQSARLTRWRRDSIVVAVLASLGLAGWIGASQASAHPGSDDSGGAATPAGGAPGGQPHAQETGHGAGHRATSESRGVPTAPAPRSQDSAPHASSHGS